MESDHRLAVLDWDQAGWGDPAVELAIATRVGEFPMRSSMWKNVAVTLFAVRGCLAACSTWASMAAESLASG